MNLCDLLEKYSLGEANADKIRALLVRDKINAEKFIEFNEKQNVEHYFPTAKSREGLALLKKILEDKPENIKKYFKF